MAYNIFHLDSVKLEKRQYFFDANIWIKILRPQFNKSNSSKKYLSFFDSFKTNPNHPRIVICSLLLSEVINRIMRDIAMKSYVQSQGILSPDASFFKTVYRNTSDYSIQYDMLCDDIKAYHTIFDLISDSAGEKIKSKHLLSSPPKGLDFNDHYYVLLAKQHKFPIITDDKDFFVEDIEVMTYNTELYKRFKDSITPTQTS